MSVISFEAVSASGGLDEQHHRKWVVVYKAVTDDKNDGPMTILSSVDVPRYMAPYSFGNDQDISTRRREMSADLVDQDGSRKVWSVTAGYSSRALSITSAEGGPGPYENPSDDPVSWKPVISGDWVQMQKEVIKDKDGNAVSNSAGGKFPALFMDNSHPTLIISRNYQTLNLRTLLDYVDSVNDRQFFGLLKWQWKLNRAPWKQMWHTSGLAFFHVSYEFRANKDTWLLTPRDEGDFEKDGADIKAPKDTTTGVHVGGFRDLNGSGRFKPAADAVVFWNGFGANPGPIFAYEERDFAGGLLLPSNL